ncbi:MAG: ATP-dependent DNA helicase [Granulosicoccaceae bacterium]|jgi:ATP-dependent DNA helicase DinG
MLTSAECLGEQGLLAEHIANFAPRAEQQGMAQAVEQAIVDNQVLVCEAGTGTGKTFAYLVPALLSGKKVIISTGTKTLQDQLFHRDLPTVRRALGVPVQVSQLKGRANYLCLHRLELAAEQGRFRSKQMLSDWRKVQSWSKQTTAGDIAELAELAEDAPIWPHVTSTVDNCLGQDCGQFNDCYLVKARRRAQEAEIVVINHHLLLADLALKEEGFGELLPGANAFVIDEAHQLPETAGQFFGITVSSRQLLELARDIRTEQLRDARDMKALAQQADELEKVAYDLRLVAGEHKGRQRWQAFMANKQVVRHLDELMACLQTLADSLEPAAERGRGLENCLRRVSSNLERLALLREQNDAAHVRWCEIYTRGLALHATPLDVAGIFRSHIEARPASWIFTSATLAVGDSFDYFIKRMGIPEAHTAQWSSPFDYAQQARLYMPKAMPEPNTQGYVPAVVEAALPVIKASRGHAFVLFTSYRALNIAHELFADKLDYPLFVQGSAPRSELLRRFRETPNAVLLGTGSFWEGVDVRGEALSCVIIDKLPFAMPDDPVLQARLDALRESGGNPFMDYQLPTAVIALKQGAGRLIRDGDDYGVLMLCDPRLYSKPYGRIFRNSLPPMQVTRELADVQQFFADIAANASAAQSAGGQA